MHMVLSNSTPDPPLLGYSTWIGMIFADHYHNNPVMVCFCQLLVSNTVKKHTAVTYSTFNNIPAGQCVCVHLSL